jgi:DNA-binding MarR family transcriptional regulator
MGDDLTGVGPGVGLAVAWLARQVELVLAEHHLTLAQYRLLAVLDGQETAAAVLAVKLGVSRPSVTTVADVLEDRGLVVRGSDDRDRRLVVHALSAEGRDGVRRADEAIETGIRAVIEHLGPDRGGADVAAGFNALHDLTQRISPRQDDEAAT